MKKLGREFQIDLLESRFSHISMSASMVNQHLKPPSTAAFRLLRRLVRILFIHGMSYRIFEDLAELG
jgi:hypothetical protein